MRLETDLSVSGFDKLIDELEKYINDLPKKATQLTSELAEYGIDVCIENANNGYAKYVTFSKETDIQGCKSILVATETGVITAEWLRNGEVVSADVSPLLMLEFGYGNEADNPFAFEGGGQGTFPNQTHAFDPNGWWFQDTDGVWHHFYGTVPQQPMYEAFCEMQNMIGKIAKRVFGD